MPSLQPKPHHRSSNMSIEWLRIPSCEIGEGVFSVKIGTLVFILLSARFFKEMAMKVFLQ